MNTTLENYAALLAELQQTLYRDVYRPIVRNDLIRRYGVGQNVLIALRNLGAIAKAPQLSSHMEERFVKTELLDTITPQQLLLENNRVAVEKEHSRKARKRQAA